MPDWRPDIRARLSHLSIAPSREAEIVEELTQHLDDRWHELMVRGETPDDAARIARTEFSGARLEALLGTLRQAHWHGPPPPGSSRAFSLDSLLIDLSYLVAFTVAICALVSIELPASATAAKIAGTWEVTIHYPPPDGDYQARYVLKQDGEKITGTYHVMYGPADVTGTIKSEEVVLSVTVNVRDSPQTARFSGKVISATKMSGTVTGTSDQPRKSSAERKK